VFDIFVRVSTLIQESLMDLSDEPVLGALAGEVSRRPLANGAWVDVRPGWLAGSATVFGRLHDEVPWRAERRHMYDKVVDVPRLLCFYEDDQPLPDPVLTEAMRALSEYYQPELREEFRTAGLCLYRDGRDSVAWHGDRIGRGRHEDTIVAILSLGAPRPFTLRPRGGGPSIRYELGSGDLLVMGGSCQRTWEHAIPKSAQATGPRVSVQFRPHGVR
jgi:alkylated DNA repair dioxygenase AlkB